MTAATLNLAVNPAGAVSGSQAAENALDDVKAAAVGAESALEDVGKAGVVAGRGMKNASAGMGMAKGSGKQLTMQMSQVVDMGVATGQWGKSFLLQLTDMAMFIGGPWTIALAGAASLLGTLGLSAMKAAGTGLSLADATKELTEAMDRASRVSDLFSDSMIDLQKELGGTGGQIQGLADGLRDISLRELANDANNLTDSLVKMYNGNAWLNVSRAEDLYRAFDLAGGQSRVLASEIVALRDAGTLAEQVAAAESLRETFVGMVGPVEGMTKRQFEYFSNIVDSEKALREALAAANDLEEAVIETVDASRLLSEVDFGAGIRSATGDAMQLVTVLTQAQALSQAQSDALMDRGSLQNQYAAYGAGRTAADKLAAKQSYSLDGRAFALPKVPKASGGGGGVSQIEQTRNAYDNLYESLDPVVAATNEWNEAQETINAALAKGYATTEEAARVTSLARKEYEEAIAATKEGVDVWADFEKASGSALDSIFDKSKTAREAVGDLLLSLSQALLKKNALAAVESGKGGFLAKVFAGMFDGGGKIGFGQTGIVGENGPEAVTATGGGAVVTSRADTARRSQSNGGVNISIDARGAQEGVAEQIANQLRQVAPSLIQAGAERGYKMTRENFGAMQVENNLYGAML